jgi:hypothetical protein
MNMEPKGYYVVELPRPLSPCPTCQRDAPRRYELRNVDDCAPNVGSILSNNGVFQDGVFREDAFSSYDAKGAANELCELLNAAMEYAGDVAAEENL